MQLRLRSLLAVLAGSATWGLWGWQLPQTYAQDFPIDKISLMGVPNNDFPAAGNLTVPDTDTDISAYGGRLRRYDVHIAKIFELTIWRCDGSKDGTIVWDYFADSGDVDMGQFTITCSLADDIRVAYGLSDRTETTAVRTNGSLTELEAPIFEIPILNITGGKVDRWLEFATDFQPSPRAGHPPIR